MSLSITFSDDAGETFNEAVDRLANMNVIVWDAEKKRLPCFLVGHNPEGVEYGDILVRRVDSNNDPFGIVMPFRAERIHVT